ncbi:carbohydrate-binding domain-containing protein [Mycolicibacterium sp. P1-5]|uniref:carbohydrate-binding domain-containing protein n=1 Tax=Mycolicibacterium sp. P1-5 TaxID=2024617 RepID=UPI0011EFE2E9|nr:carbohydrate-binding domain-containing protein [Mycolicibacterium sp. P1-5]KAA0108326.1 hypothetical protein CIW47_14610 [Mycolicibacterium sp. P1-5]
MALGIGWALMAGGVAHADSTGSDSAQSAAGRSAQAGSARAGRHSAAGPSAPRSGSRPSPKADIPQPAAAKPVAVTRKATAAAGVAPAANDTPAEPRRSAVVPAAAVANDVAVTQTVTVARSTASPVESVNAIINATRTALETLLHNARPPTLPPPPQLLLSLLAWARKEFDSLFPTSTRTELTTATEPTAAAAGTLTSGTTTVVIEGESLTVAPAKAGSMYSDAAASGRKALLLSTNSTATKSLSLPSATGLVIRARGDQYNGAPVMTVSVDGVVVATTQVSSTSWTDYSIPVSLSAGTHTISLAFTNDLRQSAANDRNLRIDKITVIAAATPPSTQTPPYFQGADWLWKPIVANPIVAANSATWVKYLSAANAQHVADLYDSGVSLVSANQITASTPRYDVKFTEPWGSDPFGSYTVAIPLGLNLPSGSDRQIAILDPNTGKAYGLWQASYDGTTNTWSAAWGGMTDLSGNGIDSSGSATATNIARYAGVITTAEFGAAVAANTGINHALFISSDIAGALFAGPATKSDGTNIAGVTTPIPEGTRIQLDPSVNVDAIPGLSAAEKVIAKTLQTYGAYVGDQGGARMAFVFEVASDAISPTNPGAVWTGAGLSWDYYDMADIPWSQLRVLANWDGS